MGRNKQPIQLVVAKNKKHLSKEEIKERLESEIQAPSDNIVAPSYLTKKQKAKFDEYAKQLKDLKIISNLDVESLAKVVTVEEMYQRITKKLRTKTVLDDLETFEKYTRLQERYIKLYRSLASDLGLNITSRCKLAVPQNPNSGKTEPKNKFSKFREGAS